MLEAWGMFVNNPSKRMINDKQELEGSERRYKGLMECLRPVMNKVKGQYEGAGN